MKIHFIYRSSPKDNKSDKRPEYFSKLDCLRSFLSSYNLLEDDRKGDQIFLNDGNIESKISNLMYSQKGKIISLDELGNSKSLRKAYEIFLKSNWDENDVVYFAEDDYLYKPEAFICLANAFVEIQEGDYFSLYEHPDRYNRTDDADGGKSKIYLSQNCHWRTVESTPQTYGVRVKVLKSDIWIHKLGSKGRIPRGRETFRASLGLGKYFLKFPKRKLLSPIPSLATHMETKFLSPLVDWALVNKKL